jgi:hypothetical protein
MWLGTLTTRSEILVGLFDIVLLVFHDLRDQAVSPWFSCSSFSFFFLSAWAHHIRCNIGALIILITLSPFLENKLSRKTANNSLKKRPQKTNLAEQAII